MLLNDTITQSQIVTTSFQKERMQCIHLKNGLEHALNDIMCDFLISRNNDLIQAEIRVAKREVMFSIMSHQKMLPQQNKDKK